MPSVSSSGASNSAAKPASGSRPRRLGEIARHADDLEAPVLEVVGLLGVEREDAVGERLVRGDQRGDLLQSRAPWRPPADAGRWASTAVRPHRAPRSADRGTPASRRSSRPGAWRASATGRAGTVSAARPRAAGWRAAACARQEARGRRRSAAPPALAHQRHERGDRRAVERCCHLRGVEAARAAPRGEAPARARARAARRSRRAALACCHVCENDRSPRMLPWISGPTRPASPHSLPAQCFDSAGRSHVDQRAVLALALPLMANSAVQIVLNLTDMWFMGRISTKALAAVGAVQWLVIVVVLVLGGAGTAVQTLVAQSFGARRYRRASAGGVDRAVGDGVRRAAVRAARSRAAPDSRALRLRSRHRAARGGLLVSARRRRVCRGRGVGDARLFQRHRPAAHDARRSPS